MKQTMLAMSVSGLFLAGCAVPEDVPLVRPGTPVGEIVVVNRTAIPILSVSISPTSQTFMGGPDFASERLSGTIKPGEPRTFPASADCYNVRIFGSAAIFGPEIEEFGSFCVQGGQSAKLTVNR